jgi:hypothetical protein
LPKSVIYQGEKKLSFAIENSKNSSKINSKISKTHSKTTKNSHKANKYQRVRKNMQNMMHDEPLISLFVHYTNPKKYSDSGYFLVGKDVTQFEKKMLGAFSRQNRFPRLL